jgi:hypothetical protein
VCRTSIATALVWDAGEREAFRGKPSPKLGDAAEARLLERLLDELDRQVPLRATDVARLGDEKLAELADELDAATTDVATMKLMLGRLGDDFVQSAVAIVRAAPRERGLFEAAMPVRSPDLARSAASAFYERALPSGWTEACVRTAAEGWMLRHPDAVLAGLAEAAVRDDGEGNAARAALAFCAAHGATFGLDWIAPYEALTPLARRADAASGWALVLAARGDARAHALLDGEPCAAAWRERERAARAQKQLAAVPDALAPLPAFFGAATIARPRLSEGTPLSDDALCALGEMLRFSPLASPYVGIAQVRSACDPRSLDDFALDLFERWRAAGEDPRESWAFESCGKVGGERCARAVAERVRGWARGAEPPRYAFSSDAHQMVLVAPGSRGFSFARSGCAILAAVHAPVARTLLEDLARSGVQAWLRREAARSLGATEDAPHDDVEAPVPDVGLDADGSATLDAGKRTFRVSINERLAPILIDERGERLKSFPRARKEDDDVKYRAAKERYASIVKDAALVARFQLALLERMMCHGRTFRASGFRERFLAHTFLRHLGRRIVWLARETTFRIAEDGTFADPSDARLELGDDPVSVAHPVTMARDIRDAWVALFADYEIVQPFSQLARETYVPRPDEIGQHDIGRVVPCETTRGRLFQLARHDWHPHFGRPDATEYRRTLACGAQAHIEVTPAVKPGVRDDAVFTVTLASCTYALDRLPPVDFSELVRDLEQLRG